MRPWMIGGVGAAVAAIVDLLIVRPILAGPPATLALLGVALFGGVVVLLSAGVFVKGLGRVRQRLKEPPRTPDEWESAFAGTGLARLARRLLGPVAVHEPGDPPILLVQSRFAPNRARREVRTLLRDYLARAQFFTAFIVLLACSAASAAQAYAGLPPGAVALPLFPGIAAVIGVLTVALLCLLVIEGATERVLDAIAKIPVQTLEQRSFRLLTDRAAESQSFAVAAAVPAHAYQPELERFIILLQDMTSSLQKSTNRLAAHAELLEPMMRSLSDRVSSGAAAHPDEGAARELRIALAQLTQTIERLPALTERMPVEPGVAPGKPRISERPGSSVSVPQPASDLGREVRELLKEFE